MCICICIYVYVSVYVYVYVYMQKQKKHEDRQIDRPNNQQTDKETNRRGYRCTKPFK